MSIETFEALVMLQLQTVDFPAVFTLQNSLSVPEILKKSFLFLTVSKVIIAITISLAQATTQDGHSYKIMRYLYCIDIDISKSGL